jgi:predicted amidohydrolase
MIIALYQNKPIFGEIDLNVKRVIAAVQNKQFDILVLPELFASGYQFKSRHEAFSMSDSAGTGFTFDRLKELACRKDALIIYGFPEKNGDKLYNSALAVLPDDSHFIYQKTHLFDTEKNIFDPGETGFFVFPFKNARIGIMICFDWRFPEAARKLALLGAQIICHPSNLVLPHCPDAMITRALENNLFTITADRIGEENRLDRPIKFIGRSRIVAPDGRVLAELGEADENFLAVEITPELADNKKVTANNDLFQDRRPDYY